MELDGVYRERSREDEQNWKAGGIAKGKADCGVGKRREKWVASEARVGAAHQTERDRCCGRGGWRGGLELGEKTRRTRWWISRGDLSREISPASSRGRQLPWCRPRDDGSLRVTEPFITSIYQPPLHLALESEYSTAIYSLRIVINVDRSAVIRPHFHLYLGLSLFPFRSLPFLLFRHPPYPSPHLSFGGVDPHIPRRWLRIDYARSSSRPSGSSLRTA